MVMHLVMSMDAFTAARHTWLLTVPRHMHDTPTRQTQAGVALHGSLAG